MRSGHARRRARLDSAAFASAPHGTPGARGAAKKGTTMLKTLSVAAAGVAATATGASADATAKQPTTVVLVHGAFADGSSWDKVTPSLEAKGFHVVAVYDPMSSLADDVAATKRVIAAQP